MPYFDLSKELSFEFSVMHYFSNACKMPFYNILIPTKNVMIETDTTCYQLRRAKNFKWSYLELQRMILWWLEFQAQSETQVREAFH